ncbi:MAG TPA: hypothetical protein VIG05_05420 [Candidatus Nitrosotenuis sp.]
MKLLIFTMFALFAMFGTGYANAQYFEQLSDPSLAPHPPKYLPRDISEPFTLKFNQGAMITFDNILVRFSNVTSDSRCPSDVTCIWQGEISVQVDVKKGNANFESIILGENNEIPIFGKYVIQLLKVEPYPQSTHMIQPDEYIATLVITKINHDLLPPLQQLKSGIAIDKIQCKENLQLIIKTSNENPICVKPATKEKLIERGWASNVITWS